MTSMVLLSKLEYLEKTQNLQTQWLTWALLWLLHPAGSIPAGSMQVFANENKIILRNLWSNMLPNTTQ